MRRLLVALLMALMTAGPHASALAASGKKAGLSASQAQIVVSSLTRGAKVFVNDEEVGEVPLAKPIDVKPGQTYTVRVQKRGYAPIVDTVLAGPGQQSEVEADLVPTGGVVKIGVLTDMSGVYADYGGPGAVAAAKLAVQDFGPTVLSRRIEIIGADHQNLMFMRDTANRLFGDQYVWSVLAAGRHQMAFTTMAGILGGNVRVGLEDSLYISKGKLADSNAAQVAKIRRILEDLSYDIATPAEARDILKLKGGDRVGF